MTNENWIATQDADINALCDENGVPEQHTITVVVHGGEQDTPNGAYTIQVAIAGANAQTLLDSVTVSQSTDYTSTFTYPTSGYANKGTDTISVTVVRVGVTPTVPVPQSASGTDYVATLKKCWEKGLLYMQADGTWSTTAQDEDQPAGMAKNAVGQGRGIVTPHKDIVCIYPEYVIAAIDAFVASAVSRASALGTSGDTVKRNYSAVTSNIGSGCAGGFFECATGAVIEDIRVTPTSINPYGFSPAGTWGESPKWCVDDVECIVGVVVDTLIYYPRTGYNAQTGDYIRILDNANNSILKWPLSSSNPQLRVPINLRGHEIVIDTSVSPNLRCEYGLYRFAVQLCKPVCRSHDFKFELGGVKIVTTDSQLHACEAQQQQQSQEPDACVDSDSIPPLQ